MADSLVRGLGEQIVDRLREDIISGRIGPGEPLRERDLAQRFAVSRGPIRDALKQLAWEGIVVAEGYRGARVAPPARPGPLADANISTPPTTQLGIGSDSRPDTHSASGMTPMAGAKRTVAQARGAANENRLIPRIFLCLKPCACSPSCLFPHPPVLVVMEAAAQV